ncbi:hypothetical protein I3J13_08410 [Agrobacterium sp. MOPV5]|uniref:hypothetical protein n=1 Tax=Agrobacterium leguminum TaxID=2792015 RepID=UPI0018C32B25|nr:hypothetical protein [Agrobacterium leguminum]MBG0508784.1 hypothetical protein [Agrobacterium leguminum]
MAAAAHLTRSKIAAKKSDCPKKTENDDTAVARILALHDAHQERRREHRKGIRSDIVAAVEIGLEMQDDREEWAYFCKYSWESGGPEEDQIDQAVRFAIKFMVGPGKGAQKKASFYYNAVALLVQEEGLRGEDLEDRLEKEGLKKLAAEYAKHKKEKKEKKKEHNDDKNDSNESRRSEEDDTENAPKKTRAANAGPDKKSEKTHDLDQPDRRASDPAFDWPGTMRFKNSKKSLTRYKVGEKVKITATIESISASFKLLVHKVKPIVPPADKG